MKICIPVSLGDTQFKLNKAYVSYLEDAGYEPMLVTPRNNIVPTFVDMCDGLVLPGGIDIDPTFYGMNNYASLNADPEKDDFERQLFEGFRNATKPIFGICRGFQLIFLEWLRANREMAGILMYQQDWGMHNQISNLGAKRSSMTHDTTVYPRQLYGNFELPEDSVWNEFVNSMHHQCVFMAGENPNQTHFGELSVAASTRHGIKSDDEGYIVEAFRLLWGGADILAVQWHPEELNDYGLITSFFGNGERNTETIGA